MPSPLEDELSSTISDCARWARRNDIVAHAVFAVSVFGSLAATVLAAGELGKTLLGDTGNRVATAVLAAIPGLMLLINNTLRFEERTKWFWRKARIAERYFRKVRDGAPDAAALSDAYSAECERLEAEWPAFGSSPGKPVRAAR